MTTTGSLVQVQAFNRTPAACCYPEASRQAPDLWDSVREQPEWRQRVIPVTQFFGVHGLSKQSHYQRPKRPDLHALTNGAAETTTERNHIVQVQVVRQRDSRKLHQAGSIAKSACLKLPNSRQPTPNTHSCLGPAPHLTSKKPIPLLQAQP